LKTIPSAQLRATCSMSINAPAITVRRSPTPWGATCAAARVDLIERHAAVYLRLPH
jgi:hypothetical protein